MAIGERFCQFAVSVARVSILGNETRTHWGNTFVLFSLSLGVTIPLAVRRAASPSQNWKHKSPHWQVKQCVRQDALQTSNEF